MIKRLQVFAAILAGLFLLPASGSAEPVTFNWSSGSFSAAASFDISGNNLIATLTNMSTEDPSAPSDILTAMFFDIAGDPTLTPLSATICATCTITYGGTTDPSLSVGGEWAYQYSAAGVAYGANYGISSSGLGLFGPADLFGGSNLAGPLTPDGVQYGITTTSNTDANDNGGLAGSPLISNQVIFTLSGLSKDFDLLSISNVTFQYGTALSENPTPVPEPGTIVLLGSAVLAMSIRRRRKVFRPILASTL
jgi:hypothetical protein